MSAIPSLFRPARASSVAWTTPSSSLRILVCTFPRKFSTYRTVHDLYDSFSMISPADACDDTSQWVPGGMRTPPSWRRQVHTLRWGYLCRIWACRLRLALPTRAPSGRSARLEAVGEMKASLTSSLGKLQGRIVPSGRYVGTSCMAKHRDRVSFRCYILSGKSCSQSDPQHYMVLCNCAALTSSIAQRAFLPCQIDQQFIVT